MIRGGALLAAAALVTIAGCAGARPQAGATVGTGGVGGYAGASSGPVSAGVSTSGPYAAAAVGGPGRSSIGVGTGGAYAATQVGDLPVSVGVGLGSLLRLGL